MMAPAILLLVKPSEHLLILDKLVQIKDKIVAKVSVVIEGDFST